jgi:hypothetical protein
MEGNRTLLLTGHSQGGTRAQLASMYLHHHRNITPTTITFAATGSACAARLFFSNSNLLQDVNPYTEYNHLTDFVHPLDPWGNSMLGDDNGQVCYWGGGFHHLDMNIPESPNDESVYEYCSQIYGWSGPTLIAAQAGAYSGLGGAQGVQIKQNFQRCRYFTHSAEAILMGLLFSRIVRTIVAGGRTGQSLVSCGSRDSPGGSRGSMSCRAPIARGRNGYPLYFGLCGRLFGINDCLLPAMLELLVFQRSRAVPNIACGVATY